MTSRRHAIVRWFCIACTVVVLPLAAVPLATIGFVREHPHPFPSPHVVAIRYGNDAFIAASSPEAQRRIRNAPIGSEIAYRLRDGRMVTGQVRNVRAEAATVIRRAILALLALVATLSGLALGLASQNRTAAHAGGFLSGIGATLAFGFLEPNLVRIEPVVLRDLLIVVYALVPAALWCRYLLLLAAELPSPLPIGGAMRAVITFVSATAMMRSLLFAFSQVGPLFDRLPGAVQLTRLLDSALLQTVPYLVTAAAGLVLVARQLRTPSAGERRWRARVAAYGLIAGLALPLAGILVQLVSLLARGRLAIAREAMALLLLPLVLVPVSLTYALLARRVDATGVRARRAVVFTVADWTLLAAAATAIVLTRSIAALGALAAVLAVWAARRMLARSFFRAPFDSQHLLGVLAGRLRAADDAVALARAVEETVDAALHVERVTMATVEPSWRIAAAASMQNVDAVLLARLSSVERQWLEERQVRLVVAVRDAVVIALGEKLSGSPFDAADRLLLAAIASSAALRLYELSLPVVATADGDAARICPSCSAISDPLADSRCAADATPLVHASVPHVLLGKYRFERRIGAGAHGVVYRARDLSLGRDVAIKALPTLSPGAAARFEQEARTVALLTHPAIATIHAAEMWRGQPMLVFELLTGGTLEERIRKGALPCAEVARAGAAICDALVHAHAAGVLHRDIKPSNVGFTGTGAAKLLDFGLTRLAGDTTPAGVAGTPLYLAPEAILGAHPAPAADVWSLGVTLFEALTGRNPFAAPTPVLTMNRILDTNASDVRTMPRDAPPMLATSLARALERDPERRITAAELRDALAQHG